MEYDDYFTYLHNDLITIISKNNIHLKEYTGITDGTIVAFQKVKETYQITIKCKQGEVRKMMIRFKNGHILKKMWYDENNKLHNLQGYPAKIGYYGERYVFEYYNHGELVIEKGYDTNNGNYIKYPDGTIEGFIYS